jgi:uncharacterized protein (TIGR04255 family)
VRTWAKAPISYVLTLVRFPAIAGMEDFVAAFGKAVEGIYPRRTEHLNQIALAEFGSEGMKFSTVQQTFWQFSREDRLRAVMIGPDFIVLHCGMGGYLAHDEFVAELVRLLDMLRSLPGITLTHLTSMGYRYVDLVVPGEGETLGQYLSSWAIPCEVPLVDIGEMEFVDGASVSAFRTQQGVLRFQAARRPPSTIPPDLDSPFVRENGWVLDRPAHDFALLDFDHGQQFAIPIAFSEADVTHKMVEVCQAGRKLFHMSVTPFARQTWEGER